MEILSLSSANWVFSELDHDDWLPAQIPGCVHTDLLRADRIPDPFYGTNELDLQWIEGRVWVYRCEFEVLPAFLKKKHLELCCDGLDTIARVEINGKYVGESENMYVASRWEVKSLLKVGYNELKVTFESAVDYIKTKRLNFVPPKDHLDPIGNSVRIRKQPCQFGWDWGPRLVTAGIWQDIRIEAWDTAKLSNIRIEQIHESGQVSLLIEPSMSGACEGCEVVSVIAFEGELVARRVDKCGESVSLVITEPKLWWPSGQGEQPLYEVEVSLVGADGSQMDGVKKRVGLRTVYLDRSPDERGESFQFVVNGRPIFIKGANWIPADTFVTRLDRDRYSRDLEAAVAANMNCVRVWGGGIYESEDFYDLCDELGLLVWQDFMFSCVLVPTDTVFLESVRVEAEQQVRRLRHRACLALWCGNNEFPQLNMESLNAQPKLKEGYETLFHGLLPGIVQKESSGTDYWPSSEWRGVFESGHALGEQSGDTHYWDVWHARHPVKDYEKWNFRFCSEFGMQSYSSPKTNLTFAPKGSNIFGPIMENHQKNTAGNQVILEYVARRYRYAKSQDFLIWLSQLNQAYCMQVGVEHYRRTMPHCMGALYWQLNDCWPVASWSSIEYTGRWKALHYAAKRFNAPALVSAYVPGDEIMGIGNYRSSTVRHVHLYTVYDDPSPSEGVLSWKLYHLDGRLLDTEEMEVSLHYGESVRQMSLDAQKCLKAYGRDSIYLRICLCIEKRIVSEQTVFFTPPRFLELPSADVEVEIEMLNDVEAKLSFRSPVFMHAFTFDIDVETYLANDNFFDLYPNEKKEVLVVLKEVLNVRELSGKLNYFSLVDSY